MSLGMQSSSGQSSSMSDQVQRQAQLLPAPEAYLSNIPTYLSSQAQANQYLSPYSSAGGQATQQLSSLLGLVPQDPLQNILSQTQQYSQDLLGTSFLSNLLGNGAGSATGGGGVEDLGAGTVPAVNPNLWGQFQTDIKSITNPLNQVQTYLTSAMSSDDPNERMAAVKQAQEVLGGLNTSDLSSQYTSHPELQNVIDVTGQRLQQLNSQLGASQISAYTGKALTGQQLADVVKQNPTYQFNFTEGMNALNKSLVSQGLGDSGQAVKAMTQYGQNYAMNSYNNLIQNLGQLAGLGVNASAQQAGNAMTTGQQIATSQQGAGTQWTTSPWTGTAHAESQSSQSGSGFSFGL